MAKELFEAIRAAEQKADQIIQEAQHQARDVIKNAEALCSQTERTVAHEQRALHQSLLDEERSRVQQEIAQRGQQASQEQRALIDEAARRLDQAADLIVERVLQHGDR